MADEVVYLKGEGGAVFPWDRAKLAANKPLQQRIDKGYVRLVNADGSQLAPVAAVPESGTKPSPRDPKAAWVAHAVNELGMDPDDADAATKQDLIDLAGE